MVRKVLLCLFMSFNAFGMDNDNFVVKAPFSAENNDDSVFKKPFPVKRKNNFDPKEDRFLVKKNDNSVFKKPLPVKKGDDFAVIFNHYSSYIQSLSNDLDTQKGITSSDKMVTLVNKSQSTFSVLINTIKFNNSFFYCSEWDKERKNDYLDRTKDHLDRGLDIFEAIQQGAKPFIGTGCLENKNLEK